MMMMRMKCGVNLVNLMIWMYIINMQSCLSKTNAKYLTEICNGKLFLLEHHHIKI